LHMAASFLPSPHLPRNSRADAGIRQGFAPAEPERLKYGRRGSNKKAGRDAPRRGPAAPHMAPASPTREERRKRRERM